MNSFDLFEQFCKAETYDDRKTYADAMCDLEDSNDSHWSDMFLLLLIPLALTVLPFLWLYAFLWLYVKK